MPGTVEYRLISPDRLSQYGPAAIRLNPETRIIAAVDSTQIDRELAAEMSRTGTRFVRTMLTRLARPRAVATLTLHIHRLAHPEALVQRDLIGETIHLLVPSSLITADLAARLELLGGIVLRHFTR
jgi:hypothetical protein